MTRARQSAAPTLAGASLLLAAVGFIAVFSMLASSFGYPDVLDKPAGDVLPQLLALGASGRAVWAVYAMVPLLLIPATTGLVAWHDTPRSRIIVTAGAVVAVLAAFCMTLGLLRWPSMQWELARAWGSATASERLVLTTLFDAANSMFGRYIGEFLGELFLNSGFVLFSAAAWHDRRLPRAVSGFGMLAGLLGLIAMWRNVTGSVAMVAELNNAVLPLWLIVWGVALLRSGRRAE
jgi:Domain of unknown function (DUF4386)